MWVGADAFNIINQLELKRKNSLMLLLLLKCPIPSCIVASYPIQSVPLRCRDAHAERKENGLKSKCPKEQKNYKRIKTSI